MRPRIIVMSHGNLAKEIINSAKMIVGQIENIEAICMSETDGLSGTQEKLDAILEKDNQPSIIIADLYGGTPCNVALMKSMENQQLRVVTGLTLGQLIEAVLSQEENLDTLATALVEAGKLGIQFPQPDQFNNEDEEDYEE